MALKIIFYYYFFLAFKKGKLQTVHSPLTVVSQIGWVENVMTATVQKEKPMSMLIPVWAHTFVCVLTTRTDGVNVNVNVNNTN